jgi:predicted transcriptional regulator
LANQLLKLSSPYVDEINVKITEGVNQSLMNHVDPSVKFDNYSHLNMDLQDDNEEMLRYRVLLANDDPF